MLREKEALQLRIDFQREFNALMEKLDDLSNPESGDDIGSQAERCLEVAKIQLEAAMLFTRQAIEHMQNY